MTKLDRLIAELCPEGVEYGTLGEVAVKTYSGGTPLANHPDYYNGDIPWLRTQEVRFNGILDVERG
jgi:type I restriction enzyme S subunit